jgi:WD40 repeat protein
MHKEIQLDQDYVFTFDLYSYNIQTVPASGTIIIVDNSGASVVAETAVSISTSGTISYTFLAAANDTLGENFKITLKWVENGVDNFIYYLFDVVRTPLVNTVRDEDLFRHLRDLRDKVLELTSETTATGTVNTLKCTRLSADNRSFLGGFVEIYINDTTRHEGIITSHTARAETVTFSPSYTVAIDSGLTIRLRTSYQDKINEAYEHFL